MTLILKPDLDMSRCTCIPKMKFLCQVVQKLYPEQTEIQTDTQTNRHTDRQTHRHDRKHYLPTYAGGNKITKVLSFVMTGNFQFELADSTFLAR